MPTIVVCPNAGCASPCSIPDSMRGQPVKCPRCGHVFKGATASAPPKSPPTIGRCQIRSKLGAGGFGTVCRAYDPQLERSPAPRNGRSGSHCKCTCGQEKGRARGWR